jgi:hypothetical protein
LHTKQERQAKFFLTSSAQHAHKERSGLDSIHPDDDDDDDVAAATDDDYDNDYKACFSQTNSTTALT